MNRSLSTLIALVAITLTSVQASAKVVGKSVEYSSQGTTMKGYLAYDDSVQDKRPGILVVHEWWGQNEYIRKRAAMLAELGYIALALDMYGEGRIADHPQDAGKFSSQIMKNFSVAKARFTAAEEFLKKQPSVDPGRIAAVGYCFGGGVVLNMAAQGADLEGVASFHGSLNLVEPPKQGQVKAKVLVLHGGNDKFAQPEQVETFKKQMKEAGADMKFIVYPNAMHAFSNPDATEKGKKFDLPLAYDAKADKESWGQLRKFLEAIFK